jgi:4-hydroxythreonine-4-phosphate dehydrogenase
MWYASPDHGTAFDIAGKNKADESSFRESIFRALIYFATGESLKKITRIR